MNEEIMKNQFSSIHGVLENFYQPIPLSVLKYYMPNGMFYETVESGK